MLKIFSMPSILAHGLSRSIKYPSERIRRASNWCKNSVERNLGLCHNFVKDSIFKGALNTFNLQVVSWNLDQEEHMRELMQY